jgi:glycosyltransferase involved in cell wall biosynthesis
MRVLHLISSAGLYGAEKMVVTLCRHLPEQGVEPVLEVFDNSHLPNLEVAEYAEAQGVPVELLPCRGRFDPAAVRRLRRTISQGGFDVVHAHGFKSNLYAFLATRNGRTRFVSTCHRFDQTVRDRLDGPILRRADLVTAVSQEAARSLVSVYRIPAQQVVAIPNGVVIPTEPAAALFPRDDHIVVGMAARMAPEKAPQDLLRAAAMVVEGHPTARFIVAGDGPLLPELQQLRDRLRLTEDVELPGFVADMPGLYASLDILALPSYREGMPMTLLEAMAAGVAVVATSVGAAPDFITDGVTGLLVRPGDVTAIADRIGRLVSDAELRRRIAAAGRDDVRAHHTAGAMAARYTEAYRSLESVAPR